MLTLHAHVALHRARRQGNLRAVALDARLRAHSHRAVRPHRGRRRHRRHRHHRSRRARVRASEIVRARVSALAFGASLSLARLSLARRGGASSSAARRPRRRRPAVAPGRGRLAPRTVCAYGPTRRRAHGRFWGRSTTFDAVADLSTHRRRAASRLGGAAATAMRARRRASSATARRFP